MANAETIQYLTQDEMKRLLTAIESKRDYALFLIAYRHGLRASEIGMLQVDDIDLKRSTIHIHRLKGSLSGVHPMRPDEVKAVKAMLKHRDVLSPTLFLSSLSQPISRRMLDFLMKNYATEAGIFSVSPRSFGCFTNCSGKASSISRPRSNNLCLLAGFISRSSRVFKYKLFCLSCCVRFDH